MILRARAVAVALCAAAVTALSACAGPAAPPAPAPGPPAPSLDAFYHQRLSWGTCADFATTAENRVIYQGTGLECARLRVPLDYAAPDGADARLGVMRRRASGERIGSLVMNPGGPGSPGMALVPPMAGRLADTPLGRRFDLVGFDPRGVGASVPRIDCLDDAEWAAERADTDVDPSPAGVAATEAENREFARRCADRSGGPGVLAAMGTRDVVRDLDVLRAALGDERLTFLGYSYGSRIGSGYAEAFPRRVRAMVLDGALDPAQGTAEENVVQAAGFQRAFDAFAADCARRPACPLGSDPARAVAAFQALTRPLIDRPARAAESRTLSYPDAITGVNQALYLESFWPVLARGLSALATGDGTILLALADQFYERDPDGHYGDMIEAFIAVSCMDSDRVTDRAAQTELARRVDAAAPFRDSGRGPVGALDVCAFWPVPPTTLPHHLTVSDLPITLVISTTGDPATPFRSGVDLAAALHAILLTVEGSQHTAALQGNPCVDDLVTTYLVDLHLPPTPPTCRL